MSTSSRYPLILLVARVNLTWIDVDPSEVASCKQLRHHPTIKIVGIEVLKVFGFFIGIIEISHGVAA